MHKRSFLLVLPLLAGCGLTATPTPSPLPWPTATLTPAPRYYPTPDTQTAQELLYRVPEPEDYYSEFTPDGTRVFKSFSLMVVSSGNTGTLQAGNFMLDVLWVYERNRVVAYYPLVLGVQEGETYTPYYLAHEGEIERQAYLELLEQEGILERGRRFFPSIGGEFVSRSGIDWSSCNRGVLCRLGQYMQETYALDNKLIHRTMGWQPIPEGWALAWMWDVATTDKITLP